MDVIPAIDFREGKVVNLRQGKLDQTTTYSEDPMGMADHWVAQGQICSRLESVFGCDCGGCGCGGGCGVGCGVCALGFMWKGWVEFRMPVSGANC